MSRFPMGTAPQSGLKLLKNGHIQWKFTPIQNWTPSFRPLVLRWGVAPSSPVPFCCQACKLPPFQRGRCVQYGLCPALSEGWDEGKACNIDKLACQSLFFRFLLLLNQCQSVLDVYFVCTTKKKWFVSCMDKNFANRQNDLCWFSCHGILLVQA